MNIDQENVRQRAYALWEQQGKPEGRELDHWKQAERELSGSDENEDAGLSDEMSEDPGIKYSRGAGRDGLEAIRGENTLEGDVMSDPEPDGSIEPRRRGRTNK
ncbi:DUF2934 domain-containing protein [Pelagibacterium limicola]|uniref:DUF2934 domain-containing protein n=1 Tax=Pelagibacterium limicola TaxID=2791022 RepID=UPI001A9B6EBA|nr:DUF2934 domain-containing protein [Pelagibacterium limicola]